MEIDSQALACRPRRRQPSSTGKMDGELSLDLSGGGAEDSWKWGSREKGFHQPLEGKSQNKRDVHGRNKKTDAVTHWAVSTCLPVHLSSSGSFILEEDEGTVWLCPQIWFPILAHPNCLLHAFHKLPHHWIQPCTGNPLGFLAGREGEGLAARRGNVYGMFPQGSSCRSC